MQHEAATSGHSARDLYAPTAHLEDCLLFDPVASMVCKLLRRLWQTCTLTTTCQRSLWRGYAQAGPASSYGWLPYMVQFRTAVVQLPPRSPKWASFSPAGCKDQEWPTVARLATTARAHDSPGHPGGYGHTAAVKAATAANIKVFIFLIIVRFNIYSFQSR